MNFKDEIITAFGKIRMSLKPPLVRAADCRAAMKIAAPGQVILRKYNSYLDGKFIPGSYSHSGLIESKETVIHAVAEGVERIDILDFVKDCDGFCILQSNSDGYSPSLAVNFARQQIGKPYDFNFSVEANMDAANMIKAFFCHKLSALSIRAGGIAIVPILQSIGPVTHEVFIADQFLNCPKLKKLLERPL